jgi:hypothetical protein
MVNFFLFKLVGLWKKGIEFHKNGKFKFRGSYDRCRTSFKEFNIEYYSNGQIMKIGIESSVEKKSGALMNVVFGEEKLDGVEYVREGVEVRQWLSRIEGADRARDQRIHTMVNAIRNLRHGLNGIANGQADANANGPPNENVGQNQEIPDQQQLPPGN